MTSGCSCYGLQRLLTKCTGRRGADGRRDRHPRGGPAHRHPQRLRDRGARDDARVHPGKTVRRGRIAVRGFAVDLVDEQDGLRRAGVQQCEDLLDGGTRRVHATGVLWRGQTHQLGLG